MARQEQCFVLLEGGHKTLVEGITPSELEKVVTSARTSGHEFAYIENAQYGLNGFILDPSKVVAIVRR